MVFDLIEKKKYPIFIKTMQAVEGVVADIMRESLKRGSIDIREICVKHSLSYRTFKVNFMRNLDCPEIEHVGEFDLDEGKFFSYGWHGPQQFSQEDLNTLLSDFESLGALNLTQFAKIRLADVGAMKVMLFRYCGANNISGRVEIAPNGDYLVIPDEVYKSDFVHHLDAFIQQVLVTEYMRAGKKVEGKAL